MECAQCGATIAQVSGKAGGYYGCLGAAKGACDNKMLVRRKLTERVILGALAEQLTRAEQIRHVIERVQTEVAKLSEHLPETIRAKESELSSEERRLTNFVDFIGEGRGSQALANALIETEGRVEALRPELEALRRSRKKLFQAPPMEWIEERLSRVKEVLERRTEQSALLLRDVLRTIRLEPQRGDVGRPYYLAPASIDFIALIETPPGAKAPDGGSNSLRQWTRTQGIRTAGALPFELVLVDTEQKPPVYQRIATKALHLCELGLSDRVIAQRLGVSDKTVGKAIRRLGGLSP